MNISELSIKRPVLSTVLTLIIILFGIIGYQSLGVREYPSVDNPIISVTCSYSGANADVIENQITEPLEQNINGIPGIPRYRAPNVICLTTVTRPPCQRPMPTLPLSSWWPFRATNAPCSN